MYGTYEHTTRSHRRGSTRRTWLALAGGLAAVLVMVALVVSACNARADRAGAAAGAAPATPTADVAGTAGPDSTEEPGNGVGEQAGGNQGGGGPGQDDGQDDGQDGQDGQDGGEDQDEPAPPLVIEVTVDTVTPGGQCSAFGTIAVSGGEYPLTVHYQWRRLVLGGGLGGVPVSPVLNVALDAPGEIEVQTLDLPEDGTNVMLNVTGPVAAYSGLVPYDGCTDGPGGIVNPGGD
jgi:hypothetical protein